MPVYDSRDSKCLRGQIIDLDTGMPVDEAVMVDTDAGTCLVNRISDAYKLWQADPRACRRKFRGPMPPAKLVAVRKDPEDKDSPWIAATETIRGRFAFQPA